MRDLDVAGQLACGVHLGVAVIPLEEDIAPVEKRQVAARALPFGLSLVAHDPYVELAEPQVEQVELSNCSIPANPNALISKTLVPMVRDAIRSVDVEGKLIDVNAAFLGEHITLGAVMGMALIGLGLAAIDGRVFRYLRAG